MHSRSRTGAILHQYSRNSDNLQFTDMPSCSNVRGFLVYRSIQKKVRTDLETLAFNYTCKQPNQIGFIPYIYQLTYSTDKAHEQSIYPKYPCPVIWGKSKSTSTQDQCRVHSKGTTLDRIKLRHIHIRNRQSADRSINDR